jgi:hypothetical protein
VSEGVEPLKSPRGELEIMDIPESHKELLRRLGVGDEDFDLFDGVKVGYEFDPEKGVRLYDPAYRTSYDGYIEVEGWSAWSSEDDRFMEELFPQGLPERAPDEETTVSPEEAERLVKEFREKQSG